MSTPPASTTASSGAAAPSAGGDDDYAGPTDAERVTTQTLRALKAAGTPIATLTAYDYTSARLLDRAGVDVLLVGDSAANVMAGHETTLPMTLDHMVYHAQCVVRGTERALVVVDLPFGSFQGDNKEALASAIRVMKETGAHAVKMEGGAPVAGAAERIVEAGIPVMGHLGLTPQSIYEFGTWQVRAEDEAEADRLRRDAERLEEAGCFALVLEKIPAALGKEVSEALSIPVIGIGAGDGCDGQVLVSHDLLGLTTDVNPSFVRRYARLDETVVDAVERYVEDVRERDFPGEEESY
ncbi:MAG: 3-methyl-2-oxobutanoate hydroxymethyltransferase [Bacteroidetes bacterium QS_8_68_15]|nr:MAG: 3-methyl-2-oxobutanoate hydroxymethyltransferase [Bacteroidetes bacterium QS_8_68_15]